MKTITIYGASDDLIEIEGACPGCDEYSAEGEHDSYRGRIHISAGEETVVVHAIFDGSWAFAICPQDGDFDSMPKWTIARSFGDKTEYSETITITLPDDATVEYTP